MLPMPSTALGEALGLRSALALAIRVPQPLSEAASTLGGPAASFEDAESQLAAAATAARLVSRFTSDMLALPCSGL